MTHTLVSDFEWGSIDNSTFGHRDHVRVIWQFVHAYGTLEAVARFETGLKRITAAAGQPSKYHATITHAFGFLVAQRIAEQGALNWDGFVEANPDLFDWPNTALQRLYPDHLLQSPIARLTFILPTGAELSNSVP